MINFRLAWVCSLAILAALPIRASQKWAPIPPETWAMKQDPARVRVGAVFAEARLSLDNRYVEQAFRIRILSESGKAAAQFEALPDDAYDIEGRTVYADGKEVIFNSKKDFQTRTVVETRWDTLEMKVIIPPGLTDNCVVDFHYKVPYNFVENTTKALGQMGSWTLAKPFPIDLYTIEISTRLAWSWTFQRIGYLRTEQVQNSSQHVITVHGIPELKPLPYVQEPTRAACRVIVFPNSNQLLSAARQGMDVYWKEVGQKVFKPYFEDEIDRGKDYRNFSESMRAALPKEPQAAAVELMRRLDSRIKNVSHCTAEEILTLPKDLVPEKIDSRDLVKAVKRGATDTPGMVHLYFELLKNAGLEPKVGLVVDKDIRTVDANLPSFQQFTHVIFAVEEVGKPILWVDPSLRYATPGLIHEDYQGSKAMLLDGQTWEHRFVQIGAQSPSWNQRQFDYRIELNPEEEKFRLEAVFNGVYANRERRAYLAKDAKEQSRELKEQCEKRSKDLVVTRAEVTHLVDPKVDIGWVVEGRFETDATRKRSFNPFPLMPWPVTVPDQMDAARNEPIHFTFLSQQRASSRFKVPPGYQLGASDPISRSNEFGRVTWKVEATPEGESRVDLAVEVNLLTAQALHYAQFREFLGWVQEACQRQIVIEKP